MYRKQNAKNKQNITNHMQRSSLI